MYEVHINRAGQKIITTSENSVFNEKKQARSSLKVLRKKTGHPYHIGQNYFIRTVTFYYTGRLERVTAKEMVLSHAAWIADTGRFNDALLTGRLKEVEPMVGDVIIGRGAIIDASIWYHDLPRDQK